MNSTTVSGFTFHTFFIKDDSRVPLNTTAPRALEAAIINYRLSQIQKDIIIIQDACYLCKSLKITISITFLHTIHRIQTAIITFTTICHYLPLYTTILHHLPPYTTIYHIYQSTLTPRQWATLTPRQWATFIVCNGAGAAFLVRTRIWQHILFYSW